MDQHDKWVVTALVTAAIAFFIMVATITIGSFVTNSNVQKACIEANGSWTTSPGNQGKSCLLK
jgi:hypothetical protein